MVRSDTMRVLEGPLFTDGAWAERDGYSRLSPEYVTQGETDAWLAGWDNARSKRLEEAVLT